MAQHLIKERRKQPGWLRLNHDGNLGPAADTETLACEEKTYMPGYAGHLRGIQAEGLFGRVTAAHVDEASSFEPENAKIRRGTGQRRDCEAIVKPFALPKIMPKACYTGFQRREEYHPGAK